jgi:hypothetical protein
MGFNISGLVINQNYGENFEELQNKLGWNLKKIEEIDFKTASSNWQEEGICDVYFTEKGTLLFLNVDLCTNSYEIENVNSLTFALSETSMAFNLNYCENGIEVRSIMEVESEMIDNSGEKLEVEEKSNDTSEIIFNQIEVVLGKRFWDIEPYEKVLRYYFSNINNTTEQKENIIEIVEEPKLIENIENKKNEIDKAKTSVQTNKSNFLPLIGGVIFILILLCGLIYAIYGVFSLPNPN